MRVAAAALVLLAGFAYQLVALPLYVIGGVGPDFVLAAVCVLAARSSLAVAMVAAGVGGGLFEAISLEPWGARVLGYLLAAWFLGCARVLGITSSFVPRLAVVGATAIGAVAVHQSISFVEGGARALPAWETGVLSALYIAGACIVCVEASAPMRDALRGPGRRSEYSLYAPETVF